MSSESVAQHEDALRTLRHDLRTPVNHIVGYCELLLEQAEEGGTTDLVETMEKIHNAGRRLLTLLDDVLEPEKLASGQLDLSFARHELRTPLNHIIGYSELLMEDAESQGFANWVPDLQTINQAAYRLLTMITEKLTPEGLAQPAVGEQGRETVTAPPRVPAADSGTRLQGRLLVVDDDAMNRDMLARRLEHDGHDVDAAENGRVALERVRERPYDVVLLDIMMPEMNGYQVLEQLKSDAQLRDLPVLLLSALDDLKSVVTGIEMGAEDYLSKPFDPTLLRARIGACLEKKRLRDQEVEYLRQVARLTDAAASVEAGGFELEGLTPVAEREDALGRLARVFQRMAREVEARERALRAQVAQLRIEIDQAKKVQEVEEITETDYFRDLQAKARELRGQKGG